MAAHQAPLSLGFFRQEHWSGLPFPSPMHEGEKWKWSRSVVSDSSRPHGLQPTRLLHPWDFPGKSTGVGCHCLLLSNQLTPCIYRFFFFNPPIKIAEKMFPLSTPFLRLEVNPEAVSSHGPPCEWCKLQPMAALNSPPSAVSGSLWQEPQTPVRGRYPTHNL